MKRIGVTSNNVKITTSFKIIITSLSILFLFNLSSKAQQSSFLIETGAYFSYGQYNNSIINVGDYLDPIYVSLGYQKETSDFFYSVKIGLIEDNLGVERVRNFDESSPYFSIGGWTPQGKKTLVLDLQTTIKWLNAKNKLLPLVDLGISTLIRIQKVGGPSSQGDSQSDLQIIGINDYKRRINPFLLAGFQYKLFNNKGYSIPIRFGYRISILDAYETIDWMIMDRVNNRTVYEQGRKTGFATYFTIGLDIKL
jgi:hypothetical protein